jgi:predicted phosphate transport protein (TIGR00153 family)
MRFLPKQDNFFILFRGVSSDLQNIVAVFREFSDEFSDFTSYSKKAKDIEHSADQKIHEIVSALNKTFITPFDREDIYMLASNLDDIVDLIENVMQNVYLFNIKEKIPAITAFTPLISAGADNIEKLMACLEKQKYTKELMDAKIYMHKLEDQGDEIFSNALKDLFADHHDPVEIIKLKDILERLERIMDKYQKVSDIIEGIIVKST